MLSSNLLVNVRYRTDLNPIDLAHLFFDVSGAHTKGIHTRSGLFCNQICQTARAAGTFFVVAASENYKQTEKLMVTK